MTIQGPHTKFVSAEKFQKHAQSVVHEFIEQIMVYPPLAVELVYYPTQKEFGNDSKRKNAGPVYSEKSGDVFKIHLCQERLFEITAISLQGWLEHEMALCIQRLQPEFYECNFKTKIFPLMPVSGSAEMFILELTIHLEAGLKRHLATRMIVEMGRGEAQAHFNYAKLSTDPLDPERYEKAIPYLWIRAMHLCGKMKDFMPIFLMSKMKVAFSNELEENWWKIHEYLLAEDKGFLRMLADVPIERKDERYPDKLVDMFKLVQGEYLEKQKKPVFPSSFH
jgi:hypothetical protein